MQEGGQAGKAGGCTQAHASALKRTQAAVLFCDVRVRRACAPFLCAVRVRRACAPCVCAVRVRRACVRPCRITQRAWVLSCAVTCHLRVRVRAVIVEGDVERRGHELLGCMHSPVSQRVFFSRWVRCSCLYLCLKKKSEWEHATIVHCN